ncbi:hypothetical protein MFIFM68171_05519 [Madurella fahalii]|uniref:Fucose-specific lectin n=1 Tax=Madurella fahalii TaxID=1157608 RepID=A0ABQ0GC06_9PEZI
MSATPTTLGSPTPSDVPAAAPHLYAGSQLAAGQWVSKDEPQRNFVACQDPVSSIVLAAWDEQNTMWTVVNITDRMLQATNQPDPSETRKDGVDQVRLFFEDEARAGIRQGFAGAKWFDTRFEQSVRVGTGMAATPFVPSSGTMDMRLFFDTGEKLGMMSWSNDTGWVPDEAFFGPTHPTFESQIITAAAFPLEPSITSMGPSWAIVAVQVERDGRLAATCWDPRVNKWIFGQHIELDGGPQPPPVFSAIAMNIAYRFYGTVNGTILEYHIDRENLTRFVFGTSVPLLHGTDA